MKLNANQQEILLVINTKFFSRTWVKRNESESDNHLTQKERLKEACWNGLTPELLPECFENTFDKSTILWEIKDANTFLNLEYGKYMQKKEVEFSVNPYAFMEVQIYN